MPLLTVVIWMPLQPFMAPSEEIDMLAYCDYIAHLIAGHIRHFDTQGILWQVDRPRMDLGLEGALNSTTKTIVITDLNGKRYLVTVEEIEEPIEELVDGVSEALKGLTIRGD